MINALFKGSRLRLLPNLLAMIVAVLLVLAVGASGAAAAVPVKLVLTSRIGWEVNKTTGGNICTLASGDECQSAEASSTPGGFEFPEGVAGWNGRCIRG